MTLCSRLNWPGSWWRIFK